MPLVEGSIEVLEADAVTRKKLDSAIVTTGLGAVHREGTFQGDPIDPAARANVRNAAPGTGDYGGVVRSPDGGLVNLGAAADAEAANTVVGLLKRLISRLVGNLSGPATWQALPTVATDLIAGACTTKSLHFVNTSAGQLTLTLKDKAGSPLTVLSFDIPAKSALDLKWDGTVWNGGLTWQASGAGLVGAVVAFQ